MDNSFYGGYQYNCKYLNKCIKPCHEKFQGKPKCCDLKPQFINPVLVRSREAQEYQELVAKIVSMEKQTSQLEKRISLNNPNFKCPCKKVQDPKLLQTSLAAAKYMNLSCRVSNLYKRVNIMAEATDTTDVINKIADFNRYQPGVVRYNLCTNVKYLQRRLNRLSQII